MGRRRPSFNRGRWAVERERHGLAQDTPPPGFNAQSIGDVIPDVVRQLGVADAYWAQSLQKDWPELVGPDVAVHARPGRLEKQTLYIYVQHPAWLMELRHLEKHVLQRLQARYNADRIRRVKWALDPEAGAPRPAGGRASL